MSEYLKCDAEGCTHIETVGRITADMVDKPCPVCSANLLTAEDWKFYSEVYRPNIDKLESLGLVRRAEEGDPDEEILRVGYHDGKITMQRKLGS